jgi:large subunit ribosomal protein L4
VQISVYNNAGQEIDKIDINEAIFGVEPNEAVVHQALVRQLANSRQGTADTKTRREVSGSSRKLYRQKHTGMARAGNRRSPLRRGGGVIFGPHPRSYRQAMPKKMRRLAIRSILSSKVAGEGLKVIDTFGLEEPKTKQIAQVLQALGIKAPALLVTADIDMTVFKSARNIAKVKTLPADMLNVVDLISHNTLLMTVDAVRRVEAMLGEEKAASEAKSS